MKRKRIICFHLFNDYSGSPKVLREVLEGLLYKGNHVELISTRGGTLDTVVHPALTRRHYRYAFSTSALTTMLRYTAAQVLTFLMALKYTFRSDTVFYINTILPIGPALAGRLTGKKVVYHYHENPHVKGRFYRILANAMQRLAHRIICVSEYQASFLKRRRGVTVIPNALSPGFVKLLKPDPDKAFSRRTVLMLSSLKTYKGTRKFIGLASKLPDIKFVLVINDLQQAIDRWIADGKINVPTNVTIHPRTSDVSTFYNKASLVLNLSDPRQFVETFGLTALEAMSCALPVIVPPVGGIAEMVTDGVNGYRIDCSDTSMLTKAINNILDNRELYMSLSKGALATSRKFSRESMIDNIQTIITEISDI